MLLVWLSRCIPGFSIIALLLLLLSAFPNVLAFPLWMGLFPSKGSPPTDPPLTLAQMVFLAYSGLVHLNMFGFTVRLSFSLLKAVKETKVVLGRRVWHTPRHSFEGRFIDNPSSCQEYPNPSIVKADDTPEDEVVHAVIVPNYAEDIDTLRTTLSVLASHPRAYSQYEVGIASLHRRG